MKINIVPNTDQIRHYAKSALKVWDVLPPDLARQNVIADMEGLLAYLDACDRGDGVVIAGIRKIERGVRLEVSRTHNQIFDLTDRYIGQDVIPNDAADVQRPVSGDIHDVRAHGDGRAAELEVDLKPFGERGV
jgi:hypothetical protein